MTTKHGLQIAQWPRAGHVPKRERRVNLLGEPIRAEPPAEAYARQRTNHRVCCGFEVHAPTCEFAAKPPVIFADIPAANHAVFEAVKEIEEQCVRAMRCNEAAQPPAPAPEPAPRFKVGDRVRIKDALVPSMFDTPLVGMLATVAELKPSNGTSAHYQLRVDNGRIQWGFDANLEPAPAEQPAAESVPAGVVASNGSALPEGWVPEGGRFSFTCEGYVRVDGRAAVWKPGKRDWYRGGPDGDCISPSAEPGCGVSDSVALSTAREAALEADRRIAELDAQEQREREGRA